LLVGIGTRLGNGCTSGHGICGIGRLSKRSIVATAIFMAVAAMTVFVRLHWIS
ncbi:YeeE/YedE family protein, partial [Vibrio vulnificus]